MTGDIAMGLTALAVLLTAGLIKFYPVFCRIRLYEQVVCKPGAGSSVYRLTATWPYGEFTSVRLAADRHLTAEKAADLSSL
jgi:hypothetical protein